MSNQWRLAWALTGFLVYWLSGNAGFILFGVIVFIIEQILTGKTSWGHRFQRLHPGIWYGFWWLSFSASVASIDEWQMATVTSTCLAFSAIAIAGYHHHRPRHRGHKKH